MKHVTRDTRLECWILTLITTMCIFSSTAHGQVMQRWNVTGFLENNAVLKDMNGFQYGFMDDTQLIQLRSTFKLENTLNIQKGLHLSKGLDVNLEKMFASFRAAYDAIYDLRTFPIENDYQIGKFELGENDLKWEYDLREIYLDLSLWRFWARVGRQIVSWGETDGFRLLDIINPLDTSYNLFFILPEENRIPLYMGRFIYAFPDIKPFTNTDIEFLVIPDIRPTLQAPAGAPYAIPLPISLPAISLPVIGNLDLKLQTHEDVPASTFNNSEFGVRLTSLYKRLNFSLNYYHGIQQNPGARLSSVDIIFDSGTTITSNDWTRLGMEDIIRAIQDYKGNLQVRVNMDMIHPYIDVAGFSYNFFEDVTGIVFRGEATYTWNMAVIDLTAPDLVKKLNRIDWETGFERNTWIHSLNKSSTFLFALQVFGRHYQEPTPNEGNLLGFPITLNLIRRDSYLVTLLTRTTYYHGRIVPTLFLGFDMGGFLIENFMLQYIVNNTLSFTFAENGAFGHKVDDIERDPFLNDGEVSFKTVIQF
jgi:hypothetical protein